MNKSIERVIAYIDGFNLYFGIKEKYPYLKWLNVRELAQNLLKANQKLDAVKYFTSMVANNPPKEKRQRTYIDALKSENIEIVYGQYKSRMKKCYRCGHNWNDNEEKMTDVNIAVHLLVDALHDDYDMAMLISGDSDLVPPIKAVHHNFPNKRVLVAFPPDRHNNSVKNVAKGSLTIGRGKLASSQLPESITLPGGYTLHKPQEW